MVAIVTTLVARVAGFHVKSHDGVTAASTETGIEAGVCLFLISIVTVFQANTDKAIAAYCEHAVADTSIVVADISIITGFITR